MKEGVYCYYLLARGQVSCYKNKLVRLAGRHGRRQAGRFENVALNQPTYCCCCDRVCLYPKCLSILGEGWVSCPPSNPNEFTCFRGALLAKSPLLWRTDASLEPLSPLAHSNTNKPTHKVPLSEQVGVTTRRKNRPVFSL